MLRLLTTEQSSTISDAIKSWAILAETVLPNPSNFKERLRLFPHQVRVFNLTQFGYDIMRYRKGMPTYPDGKQYRQRFNCLAWDRQAGKSTACSALPLTIGIAHPAPVWIGMYGPNDEAAMKLLRRSRQFLEQSPAGIMRYVDKRTLSDHRINFTSGNVIEAFNSSESYIRGASIDYAFIDEIDQFTKPEVVEGAIVHCTRHKWNIEGRGIIFALSTPNKANKHSVFRKWLGRAIEDMALYCHECTSSFYIDEFVTDSLPRRLFTPLAPVPAGLGVCPECEKRAWDYIWKHYGIYYERASHYTDEMRAIELEQMGNTKLARQEINAEFFLGDGGIFTHDQLVSLQDSRLHVMSVPPEKTGYTYRVTAQDLGRIRDATVFITMDRDVRTGDTVLINIEILPVGENIQWEAIKQFTLRYLRTFKPDTYVPDATGLGDVFVQDVANMIRFSTDVSTRFYEHSASRLGFIFDQSSKKNAVENLILEVQMQGFKMPPETERNIMTLVDQMIDFGFDYTEKGNITFSGMTDHDDCVMALAMALWALKKRRYPSGSEVITCV